MTYNYARGVLSSLYHYKSLLYECHCVKSQTKPKHTYTHMRTHIHISEQLFFFSFQPTGLKVIFGECIVNYPQDHTDVAEQPQCL